MSNKSTTTHRRFAAVLKTESDALKHLIRQVQIPKGIPYTDTRAFLIISKSMGWSTLRVVIMLIVIDCLLLILIVMQLLLKLR